MKIRFLLIIILYLNTIACSAQDTLHLYSFREHWESVVNLSRSAFLDMIQDKTIDIDTIITNQVVISRFISGTKNLDLVKKLNVNTDESNFGYMLLKTKFGERKFRSEMNSLDNRMYIELYRNNKKEVFWVSINMIDIGYERYKLNSQLIELLSNYTCLWKDY